MQFPMNVTKGLSVALFFLFFWATLAGCSSGSGGGSSSGGGSTEVTGVESLPDVDLSKLDVSSSTASALKAAAAVGEFSRAGCEANFMKEEAFRHSKLMSLFQCYMRKSGVALGNEEYEHAAISIEDEFGQFEILVRVGKFPEIKLDFCEDGALTGEVRWLLGDNTFSGRFTEHFADEGFDEATNFEMEVVMNEGFSLDDGVSADEVSSASFDGTFIGSQGSGTMNFTYDGSGSVPLNTVSGAFAFDGDFGAFSAQMASTFDSDDGAAKYSVSGDMPAIDSSEMSHFGWTAAQVSSLGCTSGNYCFKNPGEEGTQISDFFSCATGSTCTFADSATEAFSFGGGSWTIVTPSSSSYYTDVDAATLPDLASASVSFVDNWDCTSPSGFTTIDASAIDFAECDEIAGEAFEEGEGTICEQEEAENRR